jgi:diguanylate cyclase with GGDEF domain
MRVDMGASIGIAVDQPVMTNVDQLLGDADIAMYQAKAHGKGRHQTFDPSATEAAPGSDGEPGRRPWSMGTPHVRRAGPAPRLEPEAG